MYQRSLNNVHLKDFQDFVNRPFQLSGEAIEGSLDVELVEAEPVRAKKPEKSNREPFFLLFRAAQGTQLSPRTYHLREDNFGTLQDTFLVPVKDDHEGLFLEAVFT